MIVVDLEMSGMDYQKCGIIEIGAVDLDNGREFFEEARLGEDFEVINISEAEHTVLEVLGKTEEELRAKNKQNEKELLMHFFEWCKKTRVKNFICHHPHADVAFLEHRARIYGIKFPFKSYKVFDVHTVGQMAFLFLNKSFAFKDKDGETQSAMGLGEVLKLAGMKDNRGTNHNALEDAKLTAEAFSRIVHGEGLFSKYADFLIPEYLIKDKGIQREDLPKKPQVS